MIPRHATKTLLELAKGYPAIAITGPRQSGKTTLAKHVFKEKPYVSLENPDLKEMSQIIPADSLKNIRMGLYLMKLSDHRNSFPIYRKLLMRAINPDVLF